MTTERIWSKPRNFEDASWRVASVIETIKGLQTGSGGQSSIESLENLSTLATALEGFERKQVEVDATADQASRETRQAPLTGKLSAVSNLIPELQGFAQKLRDQHGDRSQLMQEITSRTQAAIARLKWLPQIRRT